MSKVTKTAACALKVSDHFYLSELTHSDTASRKGIDNTPNPIAVRNLFKLADMLEQIRKLLGGKPILITSGYRGPELNAAIGGSKTSDHMRGEAADFRCPAFGSPLQICKAIEKSGIKFGQMIWEFDSWVHISLPDGSARDGEILTAKRVNGRVVYSRGLPK